MTGKRSYPYEDENEKRFDFVKQTNVNNEQRNSNEYFERLIEMKHELNAVKSQLSDKDIADWNRHTAFMNPASTIVPYLREKLNIEIGTQAWAKMFEILSNFDLINSKKNHDKWITLHLCEAPGAFISALNHFLITHNHHHINWQWYAQTLNPYYEHDQSTASMLIDDDRLIFHSYDENHWNFGIDNSGNLLNQKNIDYYISYFQPMGINFITADGSFDVQANPAEQELLVYPLVKTEIHVGLSCLLTHGNFLLKIFTLFERPTIELIYLLYQSFRQISMFKPKTSKNGNSEIYVICLDFDRDFYLKHVSHAFELPSNFLEQILQCSKFFQQYQIETIEYNLTYFHNQNRRFLKELRRLKRNYLDRYLDQCQVRELLPIDRHLLNLNYEYKRFIGNQQRLTREGTFLTQHQRNRHEILEKIQNGFFCSNCVKTNLCSLCQILQNPSNDDERIFIGDLIAENPVKIDCIYGKQSNEIKNSCFCNRYLLDLCPSKLNQQLKPIDNFKNLSSTEIPEDILTEIQDFTHKYGLKFEFNAQIPHIQSFPILTRLQASVVYVLSRVFKRTSIYIIRSPLALLFVFEQFECEHFHELKQVQTVSHEELLQFVHIHQLLDEHFVGNLFQGNNFYFQLEYIQTDLTT